MRRAFLEPQKLYWLIFGSACLTVLVYVVTLACFNTDVAQTLFLLLVKKPLYNFVPDREHSFLYYYSFTKLAVFHQLPYVYIQTIYLLNLYANFLLIFLIILPFKEIKKDWFLLFFPSATYTYVYANSFIFPVPEEFFSFLLVWPCLFIATGQFTTTRSLALLLFSFFISQTHEIMLFLGPLLAIIILIRLTKCTSYFQKLSAIISAVLLLSNLYWIFYSHFKIPNSLGWLRPIMQTYHLLVQEIYWPLWYSYILLLAAGLFILKDQKWNFKLFIWLKRLLHSKIFSRISLFLTGIIIFLWVINDFFMKSIITWFLTWNFYSGSLIMAFLTCLFVAYRFQLIHLHQKTKKIFFYVTVLIAFAQGIQWTSYAFRFERYMNRLTAAIQSSKIAPLVLSSEEWQTKYSTLSFTPWLIFSLDQLVVPFLFQAAKKTEIQRIIFATTGLPVPTQFSTQQCHYLIENEEHLKSIGIQMSSATSRKLKSLYESN